MEERIEYEECEECPSEEGIAEFLGQMPDGVWLRFGAIDKKMEDKTLCMGCLFTKYAELLGYSQEKLQ